MVLKIIAAFDDRIFDRDQYKFRGLILKAYIGFSFKFIFFALFFGAAHAVSIPQASNPWKNSHENNDPFALLMSRFPDKGPISWQTREEMRRLTMDFKKLSDDGDLRARLVMFGLFSAFDGDGQVFDLFEQIDKSNDSQLIYDFAKIMQLRQSLCLSVSEQNGGNKVERRCSMSYNNDETERLIKDFNSRYINYFIKSANQGYSLAQYELALILLRTPSEIPGNARGDIDVLGGKTANQWLKLAADSLSEARSFLNKINEEESAKKRKDSEEKAREIEHARTKPLCENIRFTGIASAASPVLIDQVLASKDIEDTLARNPIVCNRMTCYGVAYLKNHKGKIVNWSKDYLEVVSPIDFTTGRRDIFLTIRRGNAVCQK